MVRPGRCRTRQGRSRDRPAHRYLIRRIVFALSAIPAGLLSGSDARQPVADLRLPLWRPVPYRSAARNPQQDALLVGHGAGCLRGCVSVFGADQSGLARPAGKLCRPKSPAGRSATHVHQAESHEGRCLGVALPAVAHAVAWTAPCVGRADVFTVDDRDVPMTGNAVSCL